MPKTDARTAAARAKKEGPDRLYYIYGTDIVRVQALTKALIRAAVGESEDFGLTRFEGRKLDISLLEDTIQQMPMMTEYNCVLINDYNCEKPFEDMRGKNADDVTKSLLAVLKDIPPQTVVIINVTGFEIKYRKGAISDKNKKLADFAAKNGTVCELAVMMPSDLAKDIAAKVSSRGGLISLDCARELAEMCLSDTVMIDNEIDKLCSYSSGKEITSDTLKLLVHQQSDVTVYKLANAVAALNRDGAYEAIDELNIDNNNRGEVFYAVVSSFLDLYRAAAARSVGRQPADVMHDFGYKWEFKVTNAFRDSSRIGVKRLRRCISILRDTAAAMNSSAGDPRTLMEEAVTRMFMTGNGRKR